MQKKMNVQILGIAKYLPKTILQNTELETKLELPVGHIYHRNGVKARHVAREEYHETTVNMGSWALQRALNMAELEANALDLIIFASAGAEQAIPDTAPLIQRNLKLGNSGIACFSVHSTCLSFLTAVDIAANFIANQRYRNIGIVCSERSSTSIDPADPMTYTLFGDAACAVVLGPTQATETSNILNIHFSTFGDGAHLTQIPGCGTKIHPNGKETQYADNTFRMKGKEVLRYALKKAPEVLPKIWDNQNNWSDLDIIVPHQTSKVGMHAFLRHFPEDRIVRTLARYGNCVSVSIPLGLEEAIRTKKLLRGQRALLIGTGAGFSIGGIVLEY